MKSYRSYYNEHIKKNKKIKRSIFLCLSILVIISVFIFIKMYKAVLYPNVSLKNTDSYSLYIYSDDTFDSVKNTLRSDSILLNYKSFQWLAKKMEYPKHIKSGHYIISDGMNNNQLLNKLNSGSQDPVDFTFNNIRTIEQLSQRIDEQLELDSLEILDAIVNSSSLKEDGYSREELAAVFIPNTYELYWNIDADDFIKRMKKEHDDFWNESRLKKAESIGLTPVEVSTLASIIDKETTKTSEMPRIAGVYLNRLSNNWLLQADPTLVFALGDFEIKRVLDVHKEIESPYNTYKYLGLPPGPICIPSIAAIDAVLNAEKHKYFYFCAKDDLSGYHVFARNMREHNINANKYRKALDKNRIWK